MVGALTLSVLYTIPVCTFLVKYMNAQQKEKEWIDGVTWLRSVDHEK